MGAGSLGEAGVAVAGESVVLVVGVDFAVTTIGEALIVLAGTGHGTLVVQKRDWKLKVWFY